MLRIRLESLIQRGLDRLGTTIEGWAATGEAQAEAALLREFRADAEAMEERPVPISAFAVLYVILALLLIAILWASFGTIARIVVAEGKIATRTPMIVMQPFAMSRIVQLHVKAGDHVKAGQALVSFDPAFASADVTSLQHKVAGLEALVERLEAQLGNRSFIAGRNDTQERAVQVQLYGQESAQFRADMAVRDSRIGALLAQSRADHAATGGLQDQLSMAQKVVGIRKYLLEQKAGAPLDVMAAQSSEIDIRLKLKNAQEDAKKLTEQQAEVEAERRSYLGKWRGDHNQQLVQSRQDLTEARQTLNKARRMQDLTQLRSPVDATVLEVADRSVGSVMKEAETLLTLVPDGADLFVEANVPARDISYIKIGDPVRVKLEAYPFQRFGTLKGKLEVLSADSIPVKQNDGTMLVYRAQIRLEETPQILAARRLRIQPGLVARAEIEAGRHTIGSYILDPILRTSDESMREP